MSLYEWLLFLHVLAAFLLVAGAVALGVLLFAARGADGDGRGALLGLSPLAMLLWDVGGLSVLVFGVWLALNVDGYELWDPWIIAALVLWLASAASGGNLRRILAEARGAAAPRALTVWAVMAVVTTALLLDMIFKPGA